MKSLKVMASIVLIAMSVLLSSCSKDNKVTIDPNSSATLDAGKALISFNTNVNFVTNTTFNVRNTSSTEALSFANGNFPRSIVLTATDLNAGPTIRRAKVSITLPKDTTTAQGNIVADLSQLGNPTIIAAVSISEGQIGYNSGYGTLTITKLTATEIEGTFSGSVGAPTYVISNGIFAGKFN